MDLSPPQVVAQAKALRALCSEFAFGAGRDAFLQRVDRDVDTLFRERLRLTLVCLGDTPPSRWQGLAAATSPATPSPLLMLHDRQTGGGAHALSDAAGAVGLESALIVRDPAVVFASPVLFGHLVQETDLVVVCGPLAAGDPATAAGLGRLAETCGSLLHWWAEGSDEVLVTALRSQFRDWQTIAEPCADDILDMLRTAIDAEHRRQVCLAGTIARLAITADLLMRSIQNEAAGIKFRQSEVTRLRHGEDASAGEPKEQSELIKTILDEWANARKEEITATNEDGVLPFDPRLLANKLTVADLVRRREQSAAESKYSLLSSGAFQSMISHHYTLVPDPVAISNIQSRLVNALDIQVRKDIDLLNQHAGELADRLRRGAEIYPAFADAMKTAQLPVLDRAVFDRLFSDISIEAEVEEAFVEEGVFKRLMAGRMFASMAFSFVTMGAGLFVLFGEPSIKRGLMKFSGVIVIIMIIYFIFSFLIKAEEEKKQLEEKLERIREQINQAVVRPLAKVEQTIVKNYQTFVDEVRNGFAAAIEAVTKVHAAEKARLTEQRKAEDEIVKGHTQRRQQAGSSIAQKVQQFLTGLDRLRQDSKPAAGRPVATATPRPAVAPAAPARLLGANPAPAATAVASPAEASPPASPSDSPAASAPAPTENAGAARMGAVERLAALAKARQEAAGNAPGGAAAEADPAAAPAKSAALERLAALAKARKEATAAGGSESAEAPAAPVATRSAALERLAALSKARKEAAASAASATDGAAPPAAAATDAAATSTAADAPANTPAPAGGTDNPSA
jgi:hypothetical protein